MKNDRELEAVVTELRGARPAETERRIADVLRNTIDQLLDGQHTGRYRWEQLYKTEKTHAGTLVEINLQREFKFIDGEELDYRIANAEVDCKFSQTLYAWMFPPEAVGQLCIVVWVNDAESKWSLGIVRANDSLLRTSTNRDLKRTLNENGRQAVQWLFESKTLAPNVFLKLGAEQVDEIFSQPSGQKKVNCLFVHAQRRLVTRAAVATAAQQDDFMKRVRGNGGARTALQPQGFAIFGHAHRQLAEALRLPVPKKGEFVSAQLVPDKSGIEIDGRRWRLARASEAVTQPAPRLPPASSEEP
jgi:cellobiose-specific phosphotransferase system component IIA